MAGRLYAAPHDEAPDGEGVQFRHDRQGEPLSYQRAVQTADCDIGLHTNLSLISKTKIGKY